MRYLLEKNIQHGSAYLSAIHSERLYFEMRDVPIELVVPASHLMKGPPKIPSASSRSTKRATRYPSTDRGKERATLEINDPFSVFIPKLGRSVRLGTEWELKIEKIDLEEMQVQCIPVFV